MFFAHIPFLSSCEHNVVNKNYILGVTAMSHCSHLFVVFTVTTQNRNNCMFLAATLSRWKTTHQGWQTEVLIVFAPIKGKQLERSEWAFVTKTFVGCYDLQAHTKTHTQTHTNQINSLTDNLFLSTTPPLSFLSSTCLCRSTWKRRDAEVVITDDANAKGQPVTMHTFPAQTRTNVTDVSGPLKFFWAHCVVTHQGYREPERVCCGGVSPLFNPCHRPFQHNKMVQPLLSLMHMFFCLVLSATVLHGVFFFFFFWQVF